MSKHESMHHAGCPSRENKSKKYQGMINNIYKCSQGMLKIGRDITVKLRQVTSDRLTTTKCKLNSYCGISKV